MCYVDCLLPCGVSCLLCLRFVIVGVDVAFVVVVVVGGVGAVYCCSFYRCVKLFVS